jgi:MFS family permease
MVPQETSKPGNPISKLPVLQGLTFLFVLSIAMTALAPPPALVGALGTDKATQLLSYISGAGALTEIMFSTALGATLDRTGRKPAMILTVLALATANAFVAMQSSVVAICVAKFVAMLCLGFFNLVSQAMISDMSISAAASGDKAVDTDKLVSSAMGVNMALTGVGSLTGIIGGGLLSERGGLTVIFGASTAVALLTATVLSFFMPETLAKSKRTTSVKAGTSSKRWKKLFQSPLSSAGLLYRHGPKVRILAILLMLMSIPTNQGDMLQIYAKTEWGLSTKDFSSYLALFGLVGIFASGFGSFLVKKMGVRKFTSLAIISRSLPAIGTAFFGYKGRIIGKLVGFLGAGIVAALVSAGAKS